MVVVIFRSRLRDDCPPEYGELAPRMLELARAMPGFVSFKSFASDDGERVSIVEFDTLEHLEAWRDHPEHRAAQRAGESLFYSEYRLQVCEPIRAYAFDGTRRRDEVGGPTGFSQTAELYDLLYAEIRDYEADVSRLRELLAAAPVPVRRVLDVGCGTGRHAHLLAQHGFAVDGLDVEPQFVRIARDRHPAGRFSVGDMTAFDVPEPYDAVLCLFGSIGYVVSEDRLAAAARCLAAAARPGAPVLVEPWFEPGTLEDGYVARACARAEGLVVCRVSRTRILGSVSRLEFEYLVARPGGIERRSEVHDLGLFSRPVMERALRDAGLDVTYEPEGLMGRGLYVASKPR